MANKARDWNRSSVDWPASKKAGGFVMHADPDATRVIFRNWGGANDGDIVAILLDVPANPGRVMCYEHVGQHGEGTREALIDNTKPATPEQYAALKKELESEPYCYKLIVRQRWPRR